MEGTIKLEDCGYEVRTSSQACVSTINTYYNQILSYGRKRSVILEAIAHDNKCVLANTLAAQFLSSSCSSQASSYLDTAKSHLEHATLYEKLVFDAISYLLSKDRDDDVAIELHSKVLPQNEGENYIYGMLAFPLLELGQMKDAEEAAKRGFEINKQDSWSQHALCHVLQYECQFREAVKFMEECSSSWSSCSSFMLTHNWWHVALCYLEGNAPTQRVLEVYDNYIWKELDKTDAVVAEVYLNAVALLLRLCVRDELDIVGDRLKMLADCLADQANWYMEWHLDILTVWALAKTGKISKAEDLLKGLKNRISRMTNKKQQLMQRGMMLAEALYAYGRGNDRRGLELLGPEFDANDCKVIGASDEQVDVFNEVWYNMLLNSGEAMKAIEAIERRVRTRDGTPFLWRLLERGYKLANRPEARIANEKANALESAYFS